MSEGDDQRDKGKITKELLAWLTPREAKVLRDRFGHDYENDQSLEEVRAQFDKTRERIREIERKAKEKLAKQHNEDNSSSIRECSFCEKSLEQTDKFVKGEKGAFICSGCLILCNE